MNRPAQRMNRRDFLIRAAAPDPEEVVIPLVIQPKFEGSGSFDHRAIYGLSRPKTTTIPIKQGARCRLVLDNRSTGIHPLHLRWHSFELKSLSNRPTAGMLKDVVLLAAGKKSEVAFTAESLRKTLFSLSSTGPHEPRVHDAL